MSQTKPWILGLSASHNGAACLLHGDEIVVAVQEERLSRQKRARLRGAAPALALRYCLEAAGIRPQDLSLVVVSAQGPLTAPEEDVHLNPLLRVDQHRVPVQTLPHHLAHAYSAYATSGCRDAAILVVDGAGSPVEDLGEEERRAVVGAGLAEIVSLYDARGAAVTPLEKHLCEGPWLQPGTGGMPRFRSLGGIFSAASQQIFGDPMDAGKVMGLAPYGRPTLAPEAFFSFRGDGALVFSDEVPERYRHGERWPAHTAEYQDLAASCQAALEVALLELCRRLRARSSSRALCFAGGVALNSVANERIVHEAGFAETSFFPAAEDSGPAVGAAYYGLWTLTGEHRPRRLRHDALGRSYGPQEIDAAVARTPAVAVRDTGDVQARAVDLLCDGKILGWFQGRSELGPRSLGQRSILCDPRRPGAKEQLNARVKHRELFRPFAPAILAEELPHWFVAAPGDESRFMLRVLPFQPGREEQVPAVAHVDGSGRVQTLTVDNGPFYELVRAFHERTGVPILLNTSFNVMGEPIVETPEDALWALLYTELDACVFEDRIVTKRPGYRSLLELRPSIIATSWALEQPVQGGRLSGDGAGATLRFTTATPWGEAHYQVPMALYELLALMDGTRSGWQLLERLAASEETGLTEARLKQVLGQLRRQRIIGFQG